MDMDLLIQIAKNYDPVTRVVRYIGGNCIVSIAVDEIHKVFGLGRLSDSTKLLILKN
jgi:hypothetical protein